MNILFEGLVGNNIYWIDYIHNKVISMMVIEYDAFAPTNEKIIALQKNGKKRYFDCSQFNEMFFISFSDAYECLQQNREEKLNELRAYYFEEEEWDSLAELEFELAYVLDSENIEEG